MVAQKQKKNWITVTRSQFPWEQDALDYIHDQLPCQENYMAWANFEFIADDGTINEVDLLVASPQGLFLIEIKSGPGELTGSGQHWVWTHEGRRRTVDNPILLTDRKAKRLKSLLERQKQFKGKSGFSVPYIEPLVFLSHPEIRCGLAGTAARGVCLRDTRERAGIMAAISRRECPGLREYHGRVVHAPQMKALGPAMKDAGIRPSQASRRVGDFILVDLLFEPPLGIFQDWMARHATIESTHRIARIYQVSRQATQEDAEILRKAAHREFLLLDSMNHPGIVKADPPSECEYGPVIFLKESAEITRLDHYLVEHHGSLTVDVRLEILRQVVEAVAHAHSQRIVHRGLSPQSIVVKRDKKGRPLVSIFNWHAGSRFQEGQSTGAGSMAGFTQTLHASRLIEDSSQVFIAPEALSNEADGGAEMDVFSLGALAYYIFSGSMPALSVMDLQKKLSTSLTGGLDISEIMDGAPETLAEIIRSSTCGIASNRSTLSDFLSALDLIEEELTRPDEEETADPREARRGDVLPGGYRIINRLGSGSVSIVFLVERDGRQCVLKVARNADCNKRLRDEYETLKTIHEKVRSRIVVAPFDYIAMGDLEGFTMEQAGSETMAQFLKENGALDLTFLQRFGDELIRTLRDLDEVGIAHRDIKPTNMGIRRTSEKARHLCLFDFSLSKASPDDIRVGTPAYLDHFIGERKTPRWDISSECFTAAMTLHEMATGVLPVWGDGRSNPASIKGEVRIQPEQFDPDLRDRFTGFFKKALSRDFRKRYDNPGEMLEAWNDIFATVDSRKTRHKPDESDDAGKQSVDIELPAGVNATTQLVLIGLSTRLLNALDRLGLVTVEDILKYPLQRIYKLPNVGNKTRRELGSLVKQLRERLPDGEKPVSQLASPPDNPETTQDHEIDESHASVDHIARHVSTTGITRNRGTEHEIIHAFLGWNQPDSRSPMEWPGQADLASGSSVTRQRIGQIVVAARKRWARFPSVTSLRETILELVNAQAGIATHEEIIHAVLAARGSSLDEPTALTMASIATRAAMETERQTSNPRFFEFRSDGRILIGRSTELRFWALSLGDIADDLAAKDLVPSPSTVLEALQGVRSPEFPEGAAEPTDQRLCQLAVAVSRGAALSSRMEIYPIGLSASRALRLAQVALFGKSLKVEDIRNRVAARLPEAEPLPGRPELDTLLRELGSELHWDPQAEGGMGAYVSPQVEAPSLHTTDSLSTRRDTRSSAPRIVREVPPEIAEATAIEEKLLYGAKRGAYYVLSCPSRFEKEALEQFSHPRFGTRVVDLDEIFLRVMRDEAEKAGAEWSVVLRADAAPESSVDWKNLQMLVSRCLTPLRSELLAQSHTILLTHPGLLARYDRMDLLGELASEVGRSDGLFGLWVLIPASDLTERPTLNRRAIPLTNQAQHIRLSKAWIANKHRGA